MFVCKIPLILFVFPLHAAVVFIEELIVDIEVIAGLAEVGLATELLFYFGHFGVNIIRLQLLVKLVQHPQIAREKYISEM